MPKKWLSESEALSYLSDRTEGRLATADANGQPYITPLNYILHDGKIYFHCANKGHKLDNITANNRVCFEVSHTEKIVFRENPPCACATRYVSVVASGTARILINDDEKVNLLNALVAKFAQGRQYQPVDAAKAANVTVVEITIEKLTGKRNVDPE